MANQVHHGRYDRATMRGETLVHLVSICEPCHAAITFDHFGLRRKASEVAALTVMIEHVPRKKKKRNGRPAIKVKRRKVPRVLVLGCYRSR